MKNKNILYGLLGVGAIAGLYFWNKNKKVNNTISNKVVVDDSKNTSNTLKDFGNGLSAIYGECNSITKKCEVIRVNQFNSKTNETFSWYKENGKYFASTSSPLIKTQPTEITEKIWIEKAINLLPF